MSTREIVVRQPEATDREEWIRMRAALWPDSSAESHAQEIDAFLTGNLTGWHSGLKAVATFVAVRPSAGLCGFLEASVRPMADGCTTHPVGYVEGWYVDPDMRQQGIGKALVEAAEEWASCQGCREMASDAHLANVTSIAAHKAMGFDDESPTVRFRKWLPARVSQEKERLKPQHRLPLVLLEGEYAICRLDADASLPSWVGTGPFISITRTADELSVVCRHEAVPQNIRCESHWRCLRVAGALDLSLVGVLASLLEPLAKSRISVFAVSTFDTDYLLVKDPDLKRAVDVFRRMGHVVRG
jgi:hypothetical protein